MFINREGKSPLDDSIEVAHASLQHLDPTTKEYELVLDRISKLEKMRDAKRRPSVSPDTLVMAGANLLGILLILNYERTEIITTKALGFVSKAR